MQATLIKVIMKTSINTLFLAFTSTYSLQQDVNVVCIVVHYCIHECRWIILITTISQYSIISLPFFIAFMSTHSTVWHEWCLCCCSLLHKWVPLNHPHHSNQPALYHQSTFFLVFTSIHSTAGREWCLCGCSLLYIWVWQNHHSNQHAFYYQSTFFWLLFVNPL